MSTNTTTMASIDNDNDSDLKQAMLDYASAADSLASVKAKVKSALGGLVAERKNAAEELKASKEAILELLEEEQEVQHEKYTFRKNKKVTVAKAASEGFVLKTKKRKR